MQAKKTRERKTASHHIYWQQWYMPEENKVTYSTYTRKKYVSRRFLYPAEKTDVGWTVCPKNAYVEALTPGNSECDHNWRQEL